MKKYILFASLFMLLSLTTKISAVNLARYAEKNSQLTVPPTVVFIGNSITDFWIGYTPKFYEDNNFADRGISGETSRQIADRFQQDVVSLQPKAVVILAGINDIAENGGVVNDDFIINNISEMVSKAQSNGIIPIVCSIVPCSYFSWRPDLHPAQRVKRVNKLIQAYAKSKKISYVDYYPAMVDKDGGIKSQLSKDGCHPNLQGYLIMNRIVLKAIAKSLNTNVTDYTVDR